jgi:trimeric autotransporter adhesin
MKQWSWISLLVLGVIMLCFTALPPQALAAVRTLSDVAPPLSAQTSVNADDQFWDDRFGSPGLENNREMSAFAVAANGDIYIAGFFTRIGGVDIPGIARWDGTRWHALGSGLSPSGFIKSMTVLGNDLYVGGHFTAIGGVPANNIARWNGVSWSNLNGGATVSGSTYAGIEDLAVQDGQLYATGTFSSIGGQPIAGLARWNGSTWSGVGTLTGSIGRLALQGDTLYVSRNSITANGTVVYQISRWDGGTWSDLGSGLNGPVQSLAVDGNDVYVYGSWLTAAGGVPVTNLAHWDGTTWSDLGSTISGSVRSVSDLAVHAGRLYVAGAFTRDAGQSWDGLLIWDGTTWADVAPETLSWVGALYSGGADLYLSGTAETSPGSTASGVMRLHDGTLESVGGGATEPAWAGDMAIHNGDLFVSGWIDHVEGQDQATLMRWDDSRWTTVISSPTLLMDDVAFDSTDTLYGAGFFPMTSPVHGVGRWDGSSWQGLGAGVTSLSPTASWRMYSLAVSGTTLYLGGAFTGVDHQPITGVARWDGSAWSGLGIDALTGPLYELEVFQGNLYAAGAFELQANGTRIPWLARWDGQSWSSIGTLTGAVTALYATDHELYLSTRTGSTSRIYRWDGTVLTPLAGEIVGTVQIIHRDKGVLYVGGGFSSVDGMAANNIARWDGATWQALGSGVAGTVYSLASRANDLFVGGFFTHAGAKPAYSFSIWHMPVSLTVAAGGAGYGTVSTSLGGIHCPAVCTASYAPGTLVSITATPAAGSVFVGWDGACAGTAGPVCWVTLTATQTITAIFTRHQVFLPHLLVR